VEALYRRNGVPALASSETYAGAEDEDSAVCHLCFLNHTAVEEHETLMFRTFSFAGVVALVAPEVCPW
jgi:hypothetical protein